MKIGFDAKRAFLNSSGLGNYSRTTINALKTYFPENNLVLFSPKINNKLLTITDGFEVVAPNDATSKIYKSYWRTFKLGKEITNHKLELFHGLSNELPNGFHKSKVPGVVTIHDLIFLRFPEFYNSLDQIIYRKKVKYACRAANKVIAISRQTKNDLIEFLHVPSEKIDVIYQAISPVYFENIPSKKLTDKYKLPDEFILSVGTIEKRKNQLSILKAINSCQINSPIVFIGNKTSYFQEIDEFCADKKLDNEVIFLNNIPEEDLAGLYKLARLSVYISVFEGFGLPVIESMASGCPVITSNVSCLPETAGGAAHLCNPSNPEELGNGIKKMLENEAYRNELIQKGKERSVLFHPKVYAEKLISLYNEILAI